MRNGIQHIFSTLKKYALLNVTLILFVSYCVALLCVASYYCYPNAEDLLIASDVRNLGSLASIKQSLIQTDGRYFSNFLCTLSPLVYLNISFYKFVPIISCTAWVIAFVFLLNQIFIFKHKGSITLIVVSVLMIYLDLVDSLPHILFWMSSSFVFFTGWIFYFLWTGFFLKAYFSNTEPQRFTYYFLSTILLFFSMGINELHSFLNMLTHFYYRNTFVFI